MSLYFNFKKIKRVKLKKVYAEYITCIWQLGKTIRAHKKYVAYFSGMENSSIGNSHGVLQHWCPEVKKHTSLVSVF